MWENSETLRFKCQTCHLPPPHCTSTLHLHPPHSSPVHSPPQCACLCTSKRTITSVVVTRILTSPPSPFPPNMSNSSPTSPMAATSSTSPTAQKPLKSPAAHSEPRASSPPPPEINDHERFNEGDFVLVSSDEVRFRVASHHLMAARCVSSSSPTSPVQVQLGFLGFLPFHGFYSSYAWPR